MLLAALVDELAFDTVQGRLDVDISAIAFDSREVAENGLFIAIPGFTVDGHEYIEKAIAAGAAAIIVDRDVSIDAPVTVLKTADTRRALAVAAARFYDHPTSRLGLIGVTGTNGKTSTAYFVKSIIEQIKRSVGVIGTIGAMVGDRAIAARTTTPTTPESLHLQHMFADMADSGVDDCVMEVSSHALSLQRVAECRFNTAVFTNLSPDHLELHHSMEEYFEAKASLFEMTSDANIVNLDDEYGRRLADRLQGKNVRLLTYAIQREADVRASDIRLAADHTVFTVHTPAGTATIRVHLPGIIYVYNSLAAIACALSREVGLAAIAAGISAVERIRGRLEVVYQDDDRKIIIDFAHTEDSLEKALTTLRPFTDGRLILVFGVYAAPGAAGSGKRRAMGKIAALHSDIAVITTDNPKEQDPDAILAEVAEAVRDAGGVYHGVVDRREAIQYAIDISKKNDVILIAGKGHETSQIIGKTEIPFNEAEIVQEIMSGK